jgi:hypothetical protein
VFSNSQSQKERKKSIFEVCFYPIFGPKSPRTKRAKIAQSCGTPPGEKRTVNHLGGVIAFYRPKKKFGTVLM